MNREQNQGQKTLSIEQAFSLALKYHQVDRLAEAEAIYRKILKIQPEHYATWHHLGVIAKQCGNNKLAVELIGKALAIKPNYAEAHNNLGNVLYAERNLKEAIANFQKALAIMPEYAQAHNNLGNAYEAQGKLKKAIACYKRALAIEPNYAQAFNNLGNVRIAQRKFEAAVSCFKRALEIEPSLAEIHNNLGNALHSQGKLEEAIVSYERAFSIDPNYAEALNNLGNSLSAQGKLREAVSSYERALELKPDYARAHLNLGNVHMAQYKFDEAISSYKRSIEIKPNNDDAHRNLGNVLNKQGKVEEAVESYKRALAINPESISTHSAMLMTLHYLPDIEDKVIFKEHIKWAEKHVAQIRALTKFNRAKKSKPRLRVGYLSPDFRKHSVAYFVEPILEHHDKEHFEIFCYALVANPDETTDRLKHLTEHWRSVENHSYDEIVKRIRDDRIDLLVDLAGHTVNNRLMVFAYKPAPVQLSYLGYPNTTGLTTIDYRLTDVFADPPTKKDRMYTEKLIRLEPTAWCYRPMGSVPEVSELPAKENDYITFGSFSMFYKLNGKVLSLWAHLLTQIAGSRLTLKAKSMADSSVRKSVIKQFADFGIVEERISLKSHEPSYEQHLENYREIDIALDPFPYHGTTTTCEALFMGVPVITLEGEEHRSRVGVSLLKQVGLENLIAKTPENYVGIACSLASETEALAELRKNLRARMENSPLMDEAGFTKRLEAVYQEMWQKWVRG